MFYVLITGCRIFIYIASKPTSPSRVSNTVSTIKPISTFELAVPACIIDNTRIYWSQKSRSTCRCYRVSSEALISPSRLRSLRDCIIMDFHHQNKVYFSSVFSILRRSAHLVKTRGILSCQLPPSPPPACLNVPVCCDLGAIFGGSPIIFYGYSSSGGGL